MTRVEKIQTLIDDCVAKMAEERKPLFREIAAYAVELGYTPKLVRHAGGIANDLTFTKSKAGRTLLKICPRQKLGKDWEPGGSLILAFFATPEYSEIFKKGVQIVIEHFDGKYTGCYGCGRCEGDEGYTFIYPDGKKVFRCGGELIALPPVGTDHIVEIKAMMKTQDAFYMRKKDAANSRGYPEE
ncbi:MAG: hypothetical protein ACYCWE_14950 [Eubacteriales bacterium]